MSTNLMQFTCLEWFQKEFICLGLIYTGVEHLLFWDDDTETCDGSWRYIVSPMVLGLFALMSLGIFQRYRKKTQLLSCMDCCPNKSCGSTVFYIGHFLLAATIFLFVESSPLYCFVKNPSLVDNIIQISCVCMFTIVLVSLLWNGDPSVSSDHVTVVQLEESLKNHEENLIKRLSTLKIPSSSSGVSTTRRSYSFSSASSLSGRRMPFSSRSGMSSRGKSDEKMEHKDVHDQALDNVGKTQVLSASTSSFQPEFEKSVQNEASAPPVPAQNPSSPLITVVSQPGSDRHNYHSFVEKDH